MQEKLSPKPSASQCAATLQSWLDQCREQHDCSTELLSTRLPKRVIDVSTSVPFLYEGGNNVGCYAALSHCWGNCQPLLSTKESVIVWKKGLPVGELSRTFRDAIELCRELQIAYLWIDSLCIIQDDLSDWAIESAKMQEIYRNAYLVISAAHAVDGNDGLFTNWTHRSVDLFNRDGKPNGIYVRRLVSHEALCSNEYRDPDVSPTGATLPLFDRAWALQERLLSRRIIHFIREEMVFECLYGRKCECGGIVPTYGISLWRPPILYPLGAAPTDILLWRYAIMEYTRRALTKSSDRLHAISGLAHFMSNGRWGKYIDGMWENDLVNQLMWRARIEVQHDEEGSKVYTSPSWSWASVNCPVVYDGFKYITAIQVISVSNVNRGLDLSPRLSNARLTVRGLIAEMSYLQARFGRDRANPVHIVHHESPWPNTYLFHPDMSLGEYSNSCFRLALPAPGSTLYLLLLGMHDEGTGTDLKGKFHRPKFCLVLQRVPTVENTYIRIGTCDLYSPWDVKRKIEVEKVSMKVQADFEQWFQEEKTIHII